MLLQGRQGRCARERVAVVESIRVGEFELYPSERMLSAAGKPVELGARAFDLLLVLVENPGVGLLAGVGRRA
jgi:DNA-binding response OmpR family regulator